MIFLTKNVNNILYNELTRTKLYKIIKIQLC